MKRRYTLLLLLFGLLVGCHEGNRQGSDLAGEVAKTLEEGDLLFRRGTGFAGRVVSSFDAEGRFSHVGIVVREEGDWRVVHAVPYEPEDENDFDRVKCESLVGFLGRYPDAEYGHYRPKIAHESLTRIVAHALRQSQKQVPFDHAYNLEDTTELYCTELIEYVYGLEGYSLSEGRRTEVSFPSLSGLYIFPSDLTQSTLLTPIIH